MTAKDATTGKTVTNYDTEPGKVTTVWRTACARCDAVAVYVGTKYYFTVKRALKEDGWDERNDGFVCPDCCGRTT